MCSLHPVLRREHRMPRKKRSRKEPVGWGPHSTASGCGKRRDSPFFRSVGRAAPRTRDYSPATTERKRSLRISGRLGVRSMKGVILHIYRNQEKGMIRGDDGAQVPFRKSALSGAEFYVLSSGQRVSYQVQDGWLGKEAVDVRPVLVEKAAENG